jgi:hypothetical protein
MGGLKREPGIKVERSDKEENSQRKFSKTESPELKLRDTWRSGVILGRSWRCSSQFWTLTASEVSSPTCDYVTITSYIHGS